MAASSSLQALLTTLKSSLTSASTSLPSSSTITSPTDGISLLDTKNELFLSYIHNVVFFVLITLRMRNSSPPYNDEDRELRQAVLKKLVESRVYLEKGVRPLEGKLQYQIAKLISAVNEDDARGSATAQPNGSAAPSTRTNGSRKPGTSNESDSDEHSDDQSDDHSNSSETSSRPAPPDLTHRPNPSAFSRPSHQKKPTSTPTSTSTHTTLYKPPRITPTSLPTTTPTTGPPPRRSRPSATLTDYLTTELSSQPVAEPSIGAGSGLRGRAAREEVERRVYEEDRLVRLPEEGKKKKGAGKGKRGWGLVEGDGRGDLDELGGEGEGGRGGFEGLDGGGKRRKGNGGKGGSGGEVGIGEAWGKRAGRKRRG